MKPISVLLGILASLPAIAHADLVITEVMAASSHTNKSAYDGDWWELTNSGSSAVNLGGYHWDDTPTPALPTVSTFPSVTIQPGESIIILEENLADTVSWKTAWGLTATQVISRDSFAGLNTEAFSGLGNGGDQVNLYTPTGTLVASVEFGASITGKSQAFHPDGTRIYGAHSVAGFHGATQSNQSPADSASPGNAKLHFASSPLIYGGENYSYPVAASNPGGSAPTLSASGLPSFLTFTPGSGGTGTLSSNRLLTLADAGPHMIQITATAGASSTVQQYQLNILNPSAAVILNEYNAVSAANYLNGGDAITDSDGGAASADSHFGRTLGNGGRWAEFVVTGNGQAGSVDLRGWKIQIGKNSGSGFTAANTLQLSQHTSWSSVPTGTLLTFIEKNSSQGGRDSQFGIRDNRNSSGDTWSNVWIGDSSLLTYTDFSTNGYFISLGIVSGISIDNLGTQFRVLDASNRVVYGPVGEGVAPVSGTSSTEVLELENHPTPTISPIVSSSGSIQGYDDGASDSSFGSPNSWLVGSTSVVQDFNRYSTSGFNVWASAEGLVGADALKSADPDFDGHTNLTEYAFGGDPTMADLPYPPGKPTVGPVMSWSYTRRNNDPTLNYVHQSSDDLATWTSITPTSINATPIPGNANFSTVTVQFNRPVPAPVRGFFRTRVE
jgi:hypothetical protein